MCGWVWVCSVAVHPPTRFYRYSLESVTIRQKLYEIKFICALCVLRDGDYVGWGVRTVVQRTP